MRTAVAIVILVPVLSCLLLAQAPQQAAAPGVSAQHQRMGYFAGD
jgi:hypothetical protein